MTPSMAPQLIAAVTERAGDTQPEPLLTSWIVLGALVLAVALQLAVCAVHLAASRARRQAGRRGLDELLPSMKPRWSDLELFAGRWLPDPFGRHELRYHDGRSWTRLVMDARRPSTDPAEP
jgi:hypothetical protein